jgi:RNA polymerase sigma-70 factor (ECF subfamily)
VKKPRFARVILKLMSLPAVAHPESALIEACQRGDRRAFASLFDQYQDRVYSVALHYSGDAAAAEDIAQDVFVKLFARIGEFRGEAAFSTWLYRLVVNCCFDARRKERRWAPLAGVLRVVPRVAEQLARGQMRRHLRQEVARLAPGLRAVVVLRYTQGMNYEEIAEVVGCPAGTVASRLHRAHKELAGRLSKYGWRVEDLYA